MCVCVRAGYIVYIPSSTLWDLGIVGERSANDGRFGYLSETRTCCCGWTSAFFFLSSAGLFSLFSDDLVSEHLYNPFGILIYSCEKLGYTRGLILYRALTFLVLCRCFFYRYLRVYIRMKLLWFVYNVAVSLSRCSG